MTNFGPIIKHDGGAKPAWIAPSNPDIYQPHQVGWHMLQEYRLAPDHWTYVPIAAGFTPHAGSETAPSDWDGGDVMFRGDPTGRLNIRLNEIADATIKNGERWSHFNKHGSRFDEISRAYDIIGYNRKTDADAEPMPPAHPETYSDLSRAQKLAERIALIADPLALDNGWQPLDTLPDVLEQINQTVGALVSLDRAVNDTLRTVRDRIASHAVINKRGHYYRLGDALPIIDDMLPAPTLDPAIALAHQLHDAAYPDRPPYPTGATPPESWMRAARFVLERKA